jgi:hypothetical protein
LSESTKCESAEARAEALWHRIKPQVVAAMQKHSPERKDLKFDELESNSAGVGDLVARALVQEGLQQQPGTSAADIAAVRESLSREAAGVGKSPEKLRVTRIPDKTCELATVRGPVPHSREYLYFPELETGIFPPRPASGDSRTQAEQSRGSESSGKGGGR